MAVLVLNCGSSSVKFAVIDPAQGTRPITGLAERIGTPQARLKVSTAAGAELTELTHADHAGALHAILERIERTTGMGAVTAVGHRVVHGGERFTTSVAIDDAVQATLQELCALAPLHNPANLVGIEIARAVLPNRLQVAVFDTAFHQTMPPASYRYAVPDAWYRDHGVRRYGFHGTSHQYVAQEAARRLSRPLAELHMLTAHLGNGCSAAAVAGGKSVDTTMGLTPLGGLVMGTRCGDIDPGILGHVAAREGKALDAILHDLNHRSGLLGLSGLSNDMRTLLQARDEGQERAGLAIDVFVHRLAGTLLSLCASLPRLDALVFTGGIGEHAAPIRAAVVEHLWPLGVTLDAEKNGRHGDDAGRIDVGNTGPAVLVVPTDEELMIARETERVMQEGSP